MPQLLLQRIHCRQHSKSALQMGINETSQPLHKVNQRGWSPERNHNSGHWWLSPLSEDDGAPWDAWWCSPRAQLLPTARLVLAVYSSCSCSKSPRTSGKSTIDFPAIKMKSPLPYFCTCKMGVIIFPCCPVAGEDLSLFLWLRRVHKRERRINIYPESDTGKSICGLPTPPTNFPSYGKL